MAYIAHIRAADGEIQTVERHLEEVRAACERYGAKLGLRYVAGLAGWLHDMGKYTDEFLHYIQEAVANPDAPPRRGSVDHSTAGGKLLYSRYYNRGQAGLEDKLAVEWIANCIISHHQGLRDYLDPSLSSPFLERVENKVLDGFEQATQGLFSIVSEAQLDAYYAKAREEVSAMLKRLQAEKLGPIAMSLLLKYIFSCLIDADRTNTRLFEEGEQVWEVEACSSGLSGSSDKQATSPTDANLAELTTGDGRAAGHTANQAFFEQSYARLNAHLAKMEQAADHDHPINELRRRMSAQCDAFGEQPSGIYTLSIPTGGGKTLASLRYALNHARKMGKERIIYIVPFTTIIEQNVRQVREILQDQGEILEHHSNVAEFDDPEDDEYNLKLKKMRLARDNWDSPIIFTTMVQFLNSFFAKGTRNVRRLHQMSNAVIVFDEVQAVPIRCISLFNAALNFLHVFGRSSLLLCTATQPALHYVKHQLKLSEKPEIIGSLDEVTKQFKRVELVNRVVPQGWKAPELVEFMAEKESEVGQFLVILNTKSAARKLYEQLAATAWVQGEGYRLYHLSTNMCAAHRTDVLEQVKQGLADGDKLICVSTQLIEAGVDISFKCVIRSLSGLDSIAQAAGRCNRHGKEPLSYAYIIKSADEHLASLLEIRVGASQTERLLYEFEQNPDFFGGDLLSAKAMETYFSYYYEAIKGELDYPVKELDQSLYSLMGANKTYWSAYKNKHRRLPGTESRAAIATVEQYFEAISTPATAVLVPYNEEARELILTLNGDLDTKQLTDYFRRLQPYLVNMFAPERKKLEQNGDLYPLLNGQVVALREVAYTEQYGVDVSGDGVWLDAIF